MTVTATLTKALTQPVTVPLTVRRGTAELGDYGIDYFWKPSPITIPANATRSTTTIRTNQDSDGDDETFTVALGALPSSVRTVGSASSVEVTIADDDKPAISLSAKRTRVPEGEMVLMTMTFSKPVPLPRHRSVLIPVRVTGGEPGDVGPREFGVRVDGGMTSQSFFVGTNVDMDGSNERFTVALDTANLPGWAQAGDPAAVALTIDDAREVIVSLSVSSTRVAEGSSVTVTARLDKALSSGQELWVPVRVSTYREIRYGAFDSLGVQCSTPSGCNSLTAEDDDVHAPRNYIVIPAGSTTGTLEVHARHDGDIDDETFSVVLTGQRAQVSAGTGEVVVTIVDDDDSPLLVSVSDASGTETKYGRMRFVVTLSRAVSYEVWVSYWTEDGTAKAGQDYRGVVQPLTLVFEPGETRKEKVIGIIDDNVEDSGESFSLVLGNPRGAVLGDARGTGTIYNHEATSLEGLSAESAASVDGPYRPLDIGVFAAGTTAYAVTVPHGTTHARLTPTTKNEALEMRAGAGTELAAVKSGRPGPAVALAVGANALVVETQAPSGDRQTYRVTVTRQAAAPAAVAVSLSATPNPVGEGSPVTVRATLAAALAEAVTVPLTVTRDTSEDGDHGSLASITIPAGGTSATGTVSTSEDDDGDDETFTVALGSLPSGLTAGTASSVRVTITDSGQQTPDPLTARLRGTVTEHDGETPFLVELVLSESLESGSRWPSAASFEVKGGSVESVRRFRPYLYQVHVAPKSWKDMTVTLSGGRGCDEAGAVCTADGRSVSNTSSVTVGGPVRIRIAGAKAKEGKDESLDFAVTLNRAAAHEVSVDYATADETATAGSDYTATSGTLTFAAGETAKTVSVPLLDDAIDEGKEVMRLLLSNPRGAYLRNVHRQAKGVIRNADPLPKAYLGHFGRRAASDAVAAVTARFETPRGAGSHFTFAGQRLDVSGAGLGQTVTGLAHAFGAEEATAGDDPWHDPASAPGRAMSGREVLTGTSFRAVLDQGTGAQLTSWGQGASVSHFSGAASGVRLSGEAATGALGMDYERGRWLAGFALTHSLGAGTAQGSGETYALGSTVTTVLPYARLALTDRLSAWTLAGTGSGGLTLDAAAQRHRTDLSMTLAAAGMRGDLADPRPRRAGSRWQ